MPLQYQLSGMLLPLSSSILSLTDGLPVHASSGSERVCIFAPGGRHHASALPAVGHSSDSRVPGPYSSMHFSAPSVTLVTPPVCCRQKTGGDMIRDVWAGPSFFIDLFESLVAIVVSWHLRNPQRGEIF